MSKQFQGMLAMVRRHHGGNTHNSETCNIFDAARETKVVIYSITCLAQSFGHGLCPADDTTSTQRLVCKELPECHKTRSLNGSLQNLGTVLSILQHHLLVPYLASNWLSACRPRPAATCPFLQDTTRSRVPLSLTTRWIHPNDTAGT